MNKEIINQMKKRIVILGAGESGAGAAVLAKAKGFDVFVSDFSSIKPKYKDMLDATVSVGKRAGIPKPTS